MVQRSRNPQSNFRSSSSRPNRSWSGLISTGPITIAAATKVLLSSVTLSVEGIDETILRTIGMVSIASDQAATTEVQAGAIGMIVVTDTALAAGVASIPGPVTDVTDDGWFTFFPFNQQSLVGSPGPPSVQYPFESKAKRIMHGGTSVALVAENAHATHGLTVQFSFRMLSQVRGTR